MPPISVVDKRVAMLFLGLVLVSGTTGMANLIQNGDFEACDTILSNPINTHTTGDWTFADYAGVNDVSSGYIGNPGQCVRLESDGESISDPTATQTVTNLTVGKRYRLSWDLALRINFGGAGTGRSFGVFLDQQTFNNALYEGEQLVTNYIRYSVTFVATNTTHTIIFAGELDGRSNGGVGTTDVSYKLDNVDLSEDRPTLWIASVGGGTSVQLTWPTNLLSTTLQATTNLVNSAGWSNVTNTPGVSGTNQWVILPASSGMQFFRLIQNGP